MTQSEKLRQDRQRQEETALVTLPLCARDGGRWLTYVTPLSTPGSQEKCPKPITQMRTLSSESMTSQEMTSMVESGALKEGLCRA